MTNGELLEAAGEAGDVALLRRRFTREARGIGLAPCVTVTLFDLYIAVDWSANNSPKLGRDSIWAAIGDADNDHVDTVNLPTRYTAEAWLARTLKEAVPQRQRVLVGLDFPYGYPAGFARLLTLADTSWRGVWAYLEAEVEDNENNVSNRFEVAAAINARLGEDAPFWGRPESVAVDDVSRQKAVVYRGPHVGGLSEWRQAEEHLHRVGLYPQPVWKLAYPGSVGSQALVGIPVVHRLRWHSELADVSAVWPFEIAVPALPAGQPRIIHAEIWPSAAPFDQEPGNCTDEQQVRAVVRNWRRLDHTSELEAVFASVPDNEQIRHEEGWILGAPSSATAHERPRIRRREESLSGRDGNLFRAQRSNRPRLQNPCECGCGAPGPGRFRPGHDAKLRSQLLKRVAEGDTEAGERLKNLGWQ